VVRWKYETSVSLRFGVCNETYYASIFLLRSIFELWNRRIRSRLIMSVGIGCGRSYILLIYVFRCGANRTVQQVQRWWWWWWRYDDDWTDFWLDGRSHDFDGQIAKKKKPNRGFDWDDCRRRNKRRRPSCAARRRNALTLERLCNAHGIFFSWWFSNFFFFLILFAHSIKLSTRRTKRIVTTRWARGSSQVTRSARKTRARIV